jgi:hypothetical protein
MDTESQKLLSEQFSKLPPELQSALQSPQLPEQVKIIGEKHQLHLDQIGKLKDEVVMFMMGFSEPEDLLSHLVNDIGVSMQAAGEIASEISQEIMIPIRDSLKGLDTTGVLPQPVPKTVELHPADTMLVQKTVSATPTPGPSAAPAPQAPQSVTPATPVPSTTVATPAPKPIDPSAPKPYKADPYREPLQ